MFYELPNKYKYKCMKFFQLYDMISMFSIEPLFIQFFYQKIIKLLNK